MKPGMHAYIGEDSTSAARKQEIDELIKILESGGGSQALGILDLISVENLQRVLELLQRIDIDKLMRVIQIVNLILEKFRGSAMAQSDPTVEVMRESITEITRLRANLRGIGGIRDLLKLRGELQEIFKCLQEAGILNDHPHE